MELEYSYSFNKVKYKQLTFLINTTEKVSLD